MTIDAGDRLQRVLRVMPLIVDRDDVPVAEVESRAGVDALTLLDDLRAITEREDEPGGFVEAVSILFERDSVSVRSPHFGRPVRITLPELCALELGLAMLAGSATSAEHDVIDRARARVRAAIVAMPESAARDDLWYASGPAVPDEQTLITLRECAERKTKCGIVYRRGDAAESTDRVVHPYAVLPVRGSWFLIAHCERSGGMRFFRIDRVESAERLDGTFQPRQDFDLDTVLSGERAFVSPSAERLVVRYSPRFRAVDWREGGRGGRGGWVARRESSPGRRRVGGAARVAVRPGSGSPRAGPGAGEGAGDVARDGVGRFALVMIRDILHGERLGGDSMEWRDHISVDPNIMHGVACIAGTRIPVSVVLDNLAARVPEERLLAEYPSLSQDAIDAALAYAAELAREHNLALPA